MKGFGTNEEEIIQVLTKRSAMQRQDIEKAFKHEFGRVKFDNFYYGFILF